MVMAAAIAKLAQNANCVFHTWLGGVNCILFVEDRDNPILERWVCTAGRLEIAGKNIFKV